MFCIFLAKNNHGSETINVRIDMMRAPKLRNRWNRSTYGWEAMSSQVQTHIVQINAVFGHNLGSILRWAVDNKIPGNWEPHLKSVSLGDSVRIDLDHPEKGIPVDLLMSLQLSEAKPLAEFGRVSRIARNWVSFPYRSCDGDKKPK